jgi:hypothetical protein
MHESIVGQFSVAETESKMPTKDTTTSRLCMVITLLEKAKRVGTIYIPTKVTAVHDKF